MSDDDWENDDWEVPIFKTEEEIRKLEERKLVEEADNELSYDLFSADDKKIEKTANSLADQFVYKEKEKEKLPNKMKNTKSNQKLNEEKQKELSMKIKQQKKDRQREVDIFGEAKEDEYNKYSKYEEYFYD